MSADSLTATVRPITNGHEAKNHLIQLDEVIFLRLFKGFRRELVCCDWRPLLLCAPGCWLAGALSFFICPTLFCYTQLHVLLPPASAFCWLLLWMLAFLGMGVALGLYLGGCGCRRKGQGILWFALCIFATLVWIPLTVCTQLCILGLCLHLLAILCGLLTVARFARCSLISALVMAISVLWQIYCVLHSLLIILWN